MNPDEFNPSDAKNVLEKFPDGIDVYLVDSMWIVEEVPGYDGYSADVPVNAFYSTKCQLTLLEIEPETGIFAAMSPITHRVYVYLKDYANQN
jgi:hypothetical protein